MDKHEALKKVQKLLALAQSDNANEAQAALLGARRLMAQYKLTEQDIPEDEPRELSRVVYEKDTFSGLRNAWFSDLSIVIADNHCCASLTLSAQGSTKRQIAFIGLGDDPQIACTIFDYATDHIFRWARDDAKKTRKAYEGFPIHIGNAVHRGHVVNYAIGFVNGLKHQYEDQNRDQREEMALMVIQPKEIQDYTANLKPANNHARQEEPNQKYMHEGYKAGYTFSPVRQVDGSAEAAALIE